MIQKPKVESQMDTSRRLWYMNMDDSFFASWNVRSLCKPGAISQLIHELDKYRIKIAAIQEIRWKEGDIKDIQEYTMCSRGSNNRNNFDIVFLYIEVWSLRFYTLTLLMIEYVYYEWKENFIIWQWYVHKHQQSIRMKRSKINFIMS